MFCPVRSDTRWVLLFGVTSGNRAKRGYTPAEFRDVRTEIRAVRL